MNFPRNEFKRALSGGDPILGSWLMSASPVIAEAMGWVGFDWLLIDMEHSSLEPVSVQSTLQAIAGTPAMPVVRVPANDPVIVKRILDVGAQSLMFPMVNTAEEARRAVASTRYPPAGVRGVAAMHRASRFGTVGDYLTRIEEEICVIVQIESPLALEKLDEIAMVEGVDALFVGPSDLAAGLGFPGENGRTEVQDAVRAAVERIRALGKPCGTVASTPSQVEVYRQMGFSYVAVASDLGLLMSKAAEVVKELAHK